MMAEPAITLCELPLDSGDSEAVGSLLSSAFANDSAMIALLGITKWQRIAKRYFQLQFNHSDIVLVAKCDGKIAGVLLAHSPSSVLFRWSSMWQFLEMFWLLGSRYGESQRIAHQIEQCVPNTAHWYINQVAVLPDRQSKHTGSALVAQLMEIAGDTEVLVDCATELEGFYARSGFKLVERCVEIEMTVMSTEG